MLLNFRPLLVSLSCLLHLASFPTLAMLFLVSRLPIAVSFQFRMMGSPADSRVVRFAVDVKPAVSFEESVAPDLGAEAIDGDEPAVSFGELLEPDKSVVANMRDMDGFYDSRSRVFTPLRSTKKHDEY